MKVILLKDTPKIGRKGEIKEVADGYAKNFIIAKNFGAPATTEIQAKVEKENREAAAKKIKANQHLEELKKEIAKRTFTIQVKVGDKGQIFGGAHEKEIIAVINSKLGSNLEKNVVILDHPLKQVGQHEVTIKLGHGIDARAKIIVEGK